MTRKLIRVGKEREEATWDLMMWLDAPSVHRRPVRAIATKSEISSGSNPIISYSSTLPPEHRRRRNLFRPLSDDSKTYGSLAIISQLEGVARVVYRRCRLRIP